MKRSQNNIILRNAHYQHTRTEFDANEDQRQNIAFPNSCNLPADNGKPMSAFLPRRKFLIKSVNASDLHFSSTRDQTISLNIPQDRLGEIS